MGLRKKALAGTAAVTAAVPAGSLTGGGRAQAAQQLAWRPDEGDREKCPRHGGHLDHRGVDRLALLAALQEISTAATNLRSGGHTHQQMYSNYSAWVGDSLRRLRHLISPADIERLLLTRRYWTLQSIGGAEVLLATGYLLAAEIDERVVAFEEAVASLHEEIGRWSGPERYVVAESGVYCEHPD